MHEYTAAITGFARAFGQSHHRRWRPVPSPSGGYTQPDRASHTGRCSVISACNA